MTVSARIIINAVKRAESRTDIAEIRTRGLSAYIYLIVSYVQADAGSYKPSRDEVMEAWLKLLLTDADTTKKVITDAITDAVTSALTNAMPSAIESTPNPSPYGSSTPNPPPYGSSTPNPPPYGTPEPPKTIDESTYPDEGFPGRKVES